MSTTIKIRIATPKDAPRIAGLYHKIYQGTYPDETMTNLKLLSKLLESQAGKCVIACDHKKIVGCVVYRIDQRQELAKVSGAVVHFNYRGQHLTEQMMHFGLNSLNGQGTNISAIYATTRTVTTAPQKLTENLGFKKMGILPNVHKTKDYETHCVTCHFCQNALHQRYTDFKLHPRIQGLWELVRCELQLPELNIASEAQIDRRQEQRQSTITALEIVDAPLFVNHRFQQVINNEELPVHFYPFASPNVLITSPDQTIEVFVELDHSDKHCQIVGVKKPTSVYHSALLNEVTKLLRGLNVRYIEIIVRADKLRVIDQTLRSKFVPCAYFPAFQLYKGYRQDFVIFSRSFEMLDFSNIQLTGLNHKYLIQYYESWKEIFLNPKLIPSS